jgi:hypothetical protein
VGRGLGFLIARIEKRFNNDFPMNPSPEDIQAKISRLWSKKAEKEDETTTKLRTGNSNQNPAPRLHEGWTRQSRVSTTTSQFQDTA